MGGEERLKWSLLNSDNQKADTSKFQGYTAPTKTPMWICSKTWEIFLQRCLSPLGHRLPNICSIPAADSPFSLPCPSGKTSTTFRHNWSLLQQFGLCLIIALNNPEEKQSSLGCPLIRDGQKCLLKKREIQTLRSQMVPKTNQLSTDGSGFWLPICSSYSTLRHWCRGFLRISRSLQSALISDHLHLALLKESHFGYKFICCGLNKNLT